MPLGVYLLIDHRNDNEQNSTSWVFLCLDGTETQAELEKAYDSLPEIMQLLILLSSYDRIPEEEIAEMLNCDLETVTSILKAAKSRLERQFGQTASKKELAAMLEQKIQNFHVPEDLQKRVRDIISVWINNN